jgi:4'-phosphopantetheinyl transferase EntD
VSASLRKLVPADVAVIETCGQDGEPSPLYPEEAVHVERAVEKRRRDFALGRACARRALAVLDDRPPTAILVGEERAPVWPEGIVGSIIPYRSRHSRNSQTTSS